MINYHYEAGDKAMINKMTINRDLVNCHEWEPTIVLLCYREYRLAHDYEKLWKCHIQKSTGYHNAFALW